MNKFWNKVLMLLYNIVGKKWNEAMKSIQIPWQSIQKQLTMSEIFTSLWENMLFDFILLLFDIWPELCTIKYTNLRNSVERKIID